MRALLAVLLVGLAACYSPRNIGPGPDGYVGAHGGAWEQEPLRASLWIDPQNGFTSFDLNRPAHVALFQWQPGSHFSIVYPSIGLGTRQHFYAGRNYLHTHGFASARSAHRGSVFQTSFGTGIGGPTYYVLVASEEPLRVSPFFGHAPWVTRVGWSNNLYTATEMLASQIVPSPGTTDWTVAYQMVWLEDGRAPMQSYRWVVCPDGTTMAVPLPILMAGAVVCPDGSQPAVPGDDDDVEVEAPITRIAERVEGLRGRDTGLEGGRADETELREMIRRIHEARGTAGEAQVPAAAWRRAERERAAARPMATAERPVIRTVAPPAMTVLGQPGQRADRTRPGADRWPTRADRAPEPVRIPEAHRPPPRSADRQPAPRPVERPAPQRPPPSSPPERRPPPDDAS